MKKLREVFLPAALPCEQSVSVKASVFLFYSSVWM